MPKKKILYWNPTELENLEYECAVIGNDPDFEVLMVKDAPDSEFLKYGADVDALAVDYLNITDELLQQMPNVKIIVRRGVGFEQFDLDAFNKHGVLGCNLPTYCMKEVALHTMVLALSCGRFITELNARTQRGDGDYSDIQMHRPDGQVYGMVSLGRIPRQVVPALKALGFRVVTWDPYLAQSACDGLGVERVDELDELLAMSDYVSVNTPLNEQTRGMMSRERLEKIKEGAIVVCSSRGGIIDEAALADLLRSGKLRGAGLDVLEDEIAFETPLRGLKNVILTPHVAYYSEEAEETLRTQTIEIMYKALRDGEYPESLLNRDVVGHSRID